MTKYPPPGDRRNDPEFDPEVGGTPAPTRDDIGRVYLDTRGVRQMLAAINPADGAEFDVLVARVEPLGGVHPRRWTDFRNLTATDERIEATR